MSVGSRETEWSTVNGSGQTTGDPSTAGHCVPGKLEVSRKEGGGGARLGLG